MISPAVSLQAIVNKSLLGPENEVMHAGLRARTRARGAVDERQQLLRITGLRGAATRASPPLFC